MSDVFIVHFLDSHADFPKVDDCLGLGEDLFGVHVVE
jgi:hypothetical protein